MKERADAMPSLAAAIAGRLGAVVRESLDPQTMDDYKKFAHQADALLASSDLLNERVNICDSMSSTLCARLARYDDVQERRAIKARSIMDEMKPTLIEYIKMSSPKSRAAAFAQKDHDRSRLDFNSIDVTTDSTIFAPTQTPVPSLSPIRRQFESSKREMRALLDSLKQKRGRGPQHCGAISPTNVERSVVAEAEDIGSVPPAGGDSGEGSMSFGKYVPSKNLPRLEGGSTQAPATTLALAVSLALFLIRDFLSMDTKSTRYDCKILIFNLKKKYIV